MAQWPRPQNVEAYVRHSKIRTIHFGIGAIGSEVVRLAARRPDIEIVGAIDSNPGKAGKDLGEVAGLGRSLGIEISYNPESILRDFYADVVVHTTGSSLTVVYPELAQILDAERSIVSSCEELSYPWSRRADLAQTLDQKAREKGVRILGTGVNPGFVMDMLPLFLATTCQEVKSIHVRRVVDIAARRVQLQRKLGIGLSVAGFKQAAADEAVGHVGLRESASLIAETIGWRLDALTETVEPVQARGKLKTEYFTLEKGAVAGVKQVAVGSAAGQEVLRLELEMSLGAENPHDYIRIEGTPPLEVRIAGGVQGDQATAAIIVNCLPAIAFSGAQVGLLTMRDMPAVPFWRPRPSPSERIAGL